MHHKELLQQRRKRKIKKRELESLKEESIEDEESEDGDDDESKKGGENKKEDEDIFIEHSNKVSKKTEKVMKKKKNEELRRAISEYIKDKDDSDNTSGRAKSGGLESSEQPGDSLEQSGKLIKRNLSKRMGTNANEDNIYTFLRPSVQKRKVMGLLMAG